MLHEGKKPSRGGRKTWQRNAEAVARHKSGAGGVGLDLLGRGTEAGPPQPSPPQHSQHLRLLQDQPLNLLIMKRCGVREPPGGLRGPDTHPGAGAGGLLAAGGGHHCWGSGAGRYGSATAPLAPRQPPAAGERRHWAAGPGSRPMDALGEREQGSPAHAVPSVGGVGREWGKEQWWELWEGDEKKKK